MLTRWFIGVKAASKGYVTGFRGRGEGDSGLPTFTKQTALARGYTSEKDALAGINTYRIAAQKDLDTFQEKLDNLLRLQPTWDQKTPKEKYYEIKTNSDIKIEYTENSEHFYRPLVRYLNLKYIDFNELTVSQIGVLTEVTLDKLIEKNRQIVDYYKRQLEFINTKLLVREVPLEFKFKDSERRGIKWVMRSETATSYGYCMACGGAIPSIPQLKISNLGSICAICMVKLAEEAKIQAGKISDEIMEHYQTDRFLRSM